MRPRPYPTRELEVWYIRPVPNGETNASIRRTTASAERPTIPARPANGPARMFGLLIFAHPWAIWLLGIAPMNATCSMQ